MAVGREVGRHVDRVGLDRDRRREVHLLPARARLAREGHRPEALAAAVDHRLPDVRPGVGGGSCRSGCPVMEPATSDWNFTPSSTALGIAAVDDGRRSGWTARSSNDPVFTVMLRALVTFWAPGGHLNGEAGGAGRRRRARDHARARRRASAPRAACRCDRPGVRRRPARGREGRRVGQRPRVAAGSAVVVIVSGPATTVSPVLPLTEPSVAEIVVVPGRHRGRQPRRRSPSPPPCSTTPTSPGSSGSACSRPSTSRWR